MTQNPFVDPEFPDRQVTTGPMDSRAPDHSDFVSPQVVDYFSFTSFHRFMFPDGVQYIEFKVMNEGDKLKFQKETGRDIKVNTQTNEAAIRPDSGSDRHALIKSSVTLMFMKAPGVGLQEWPVVWGASKNSTPGNRVLEQFLQLADPRIVEDLEKEIRKANPWLLGEVTVEDIDKQIEELKEMREVAVEREQGEGSSSSK